MRKFKFKSKYASDSKGSKSVHTLTIEDMISQRTNPTYDQMGQIETLEGDVKELRKIVSLLIEELPEDKLKKFIDTNLKPYNYE